MKLNYGKAITKTVETCMTYHKIFMFFYLYNLNDHPCKKILLSLIVRCAFTIIVYKEI